MTIKSIAAAVNGSTTTFVRSDGTAATPSGGGGGGAPNGAEYVTLLANGSLTNERVLTAGTGIVIVDSGAGAAVTISTNTLDTIPEPVASVDFAQQQALRFRIENRTSDPASPAVGEIWLRTDL
jgi:hypothetical protein